MSSPPSEPAQTYIVPISTPMDLNGGGTEQSSLVHLRFSRGKTAVCLELICGLVVFSWNKTSIHLEYTVKLFLVAVMLRFDSG